MIRAYELLEKDGYVASKKGSGFFIKNNRNQHIFYSEDYMANEDFKYNYFNENCAIDFSLTLNLIVCFPPGLIEMILGNITISSIKLFSKYSGIISV